MSLLKPGKTGLAFFSITTLLITISNINCTRDNDIVDVTNPLFIDSLITNAPLRFHVTEYSRSGNITFDNYSSVQVDKEKRQVRFYADNILTTTPFDQLVEVHQFNNDWYLSEIQVPASSGGAALPLYFLRNGNDLYKMVDPGGNWLGKGDTVTVSFADAIPGLQLRQTSRQNLTGTITKKISNFLKDRPGICSFISDTMQLFNPAKINVQNTGLEYDAQDRVIRRREDNSLEEIIISYDSQPNNLQIFNNEGTLGRDYRYLSPDLVYSSFSVDVMPHIKLDYASASNYNYNHYLSLFKYGSYYKSVVHKYSKAGVAAQETFNFTNTYDNKNRLVKMLIMLNGIQKYYELSIDYSN